MSEPLHLKRLELRDPTTDTAVGFVVPTHELDAITEQSQSTIRKIQELEKTVQDLSDERDRYLETLHAMTRDHRISFSPEELQEMESNGDIFTVFIDQLS